MSLKWTFSSATTLIPQDLKHHPSWIADMATDLDGVVSADIRSRLLAFRGHDLS